MDDTANSLLLEVFLSPYCIFNDNIILVLNATLLEDLQIIVSFWPYAVHRDFSEFFSDTVDDEIFNVFTILH